MLNKVGTFSERFCTLCAAAFVCVILIQNLLHLPSLQTLIVLASLLGGCCVLALCLRYLRPFRGFAPALFLVRFTLALFFILWLGSQPVQDFATMYSAAQQLATGSRAYLDNIYFYNWAYQSAFTAYEALILSLFGDALFPLQLLNAAYLAGTNVFVYLIAKRFLPEKAAMTTGVLYAIYPAPLFLAGVLTNQHLSVFFALQRFISFTLQGSYSPARSWRRHHHSDGQRHTAHRHDFDVGYCSVAVDSRRPSV